jgi:hypothetical protein
MPDLAGLDLALLVVAALAAGVVDAIAGGGGLITLPALLAAGVPPQLALGTNKGQSVFGSAAALVRFARAGLVDRTRARIAFPAGLAGSLAGALAVTAIPPARLRPVVLALLVLAGVVVGLRRGPPRVEARVPPRLAPLATAVIALVIGAYDGFFGPGTGTFLIVAFASLLGDGLRRASAEAKVVNFASNLAAVVLFASRGLVLWQVALPMAAAQAAGGALGAHLAVRRGDLLVRRVVLLVVLALVAKLARDLWVA